MRVVLRLISFFLLILMSIPTVLANALFMGNPVANGATACKQDCQAKWASSIELGYVSVSGSTETNTFNGRFGLSYEKKKWRHGGFLAIQSSSSEDKLTNIKTDAEKLTAQVKSDYQYSGSAYAFGMVDYDETKGSGFDYQASYAFGAGYRFLDSDTHKLDGELGLGTRKSKTELTNLTNSEGIIRIAALYKWQLSKTSNFEQQISTEIGDDNTIYKSLTSLSANMLDNLALKVSYTLKHQSNVPVANDKLETVTSFTIVYSF